MKLRKRFGVVLVLAMLVSVLAMTMTASAAKKTKISKKSATIAAGQSVKLSVKNAKGKKVKWSSEDEDVAKVGSNGKVTGLTGGVAVIKAKVGGKSYKCNVTVEAVEFKDLDKEDPRILLSGDAGTNDTTSAASNIVSGYNKYDLKPHLSTYPAGLAVKWSTSNDKVATVEDGVVKAVTNGTCTITAAATDGSGAAASVIVAVHNLGEQDNTNPIVITMANFDTVFNKYFKKVTLTEAYYDKDGKILAPDTEYWILKDGKQQQCWVPGGEKEPVGFPYSEEYYYVVTDPTIDILKSTGTASYRYYINENLADIASKAGAPVLGNKDKTVSKSTYNELKSYYYGLADAYWDETGDIHIVYAQQNTFPKEEFEPIFYKVTVKENGKDVVKTYEGKHWFAKYDVAGVAGKQLLNYDAGFGYLDMPTKGCYTFTYTSDQTFNQMSTSLYKK